MPYTAVNETKHVGIIESPIGNCLGIQSMDCHIFMFQFIFYGPNLHTSQETRHSFWQFEIQLCFDALYMCFVPMDAILDGGFCNKYRLT